MNPYLIDRGFYFKTKTILFCYINMNIVNPNLGVNNIAITPRYYNDVGVNLVFEFIDEDSRVVNGISISNLTKDSGLLSFDVTTTFIDNTSYTLKITDSDLQEIIYRGIVFATDQTAQNYEING